MPTKITFLLEILTFDASTSDRKRSYPITLESPKTMGRTVIRLKQKRKKDYLILILHTERNKGGRNETETNAIMRFSVS